MSDTTPTLSRRRVLATTTAAGLVGVAGCGGADDTNETEETEETPTGEEPNETEEPDTEEERDEPTNDVELLHAWAPSDGKAAIEALIDGFQEQHPDVTITEESVEGGFPGDLNQAVLDRVRANNPPSTFQAWPGKSLELFEDTFEDIEEDVWNADLKENYPPGLQELAQHGEDYVTVPVNIHRINNLYYNTAIVEEAGVDPKAFEVPSDVVTACATIESATDAVPFAHQTSSAWSTVQLWETILLGQAGIDGYEAFINGNGDRNQVEAALEAVVDLTEYYPRDASSINFTEANQMVINGEAAFIQQGDWVTATGGEGEAATGGEEWAYGRIDDFTYSDDWNQVTYPGTSGSYLLNMDSFPYMAENPSPVATRLFLRYAGSPEGQVLFNDTKGSIPPRSDADVTRLTLPQQDQFADYTAAENLPPSIQHGLAVSPDVKAKISDTFDQFIEGYDVTEAASSLLNAFD